MAAGSEPKATAGTVTLAAAGKSGSGGSSGYPSAAARDGGFAALQARPCSTMLPYDNADDDEQDELERELTRELTQDFGLLTCRGANTGAADQQEQQAVSPDGSSMACSSAVGFDDEEEEVVDEQLLPSLYDQLGGGVAVKKVVDSFYARVLGDPQLGRFFVGVDMSKHTRKFLLFATFVLGGPDEYLRRNPEPWPQLALAHERLIDAMGLTEVHFDLVKAHFATSLRDVGAPQSVLEQALDIVESTRTVIFPPKPPAATSAAADASPGNTGPGKSKAGAV